MAHGRFDRHCVTNHPRWWSRYARVWQTAGASTTSANLSGLPPCRTVEEVRAQFGDDFSGAVEGARWVAQNPSEIRALTGELFPTGVI